MYIDTHSHIDFSDFDVDRENILEDALKTGVSSIINVGTDVDSSEFSLKLSEKYDLIKAAVGIHPSEIGNFDLKDMKKICKLAKNDKVVTIGEAGLDFYRDRDVVF